MGDKAVCASKRRPLAHAEVHSVTSNVCNAFCSCMSGVLKSPTPQDPPAAPVVNPTTSSYHHIQKQMRVDGLCPTNLIG